ncbi:MAG TPA: hypothetical protein VHO69_15655, partial [Phototrophicaceae bacterium]|nr:hypothetical protein [Phototrophicaceae bacterium]
GTYAGNVYLWDIGTKQVVPIVQLPGFIQALSWNNSGTQIAITNLWDQVIWDTVLHQKVISLQKVTDSIHSLSWHPNGDYIIGASQQGNLVIWNAKDGQVLQQYSVGNSVITSVAWNKAGTMLAVTLADGTTKLFETNI